MRLGWFGLASVERLAAAAVASIVATLQLGCSESNEGNVRVAPPLSSLMSSGGTSVIPNGGSGNPTAGSGSSTGGSSNGGPGDIDKPWPSTGCGKDPPADQVPTVVGSRTGYTEYWVNETGATLGADQPTKANPRQYFVRVPPDYDSSHPYRIVYIGQGCGASHAGKTATYPLFDEKQGGSEQAIYVGVSVPDDGSNPGCFDNNSGPESQEWEAFELMHTAIEGAFCVDNNRIFVAGYSTGGWLSNMWGCYFGGTPATPLDKTTVDTARAAEGKPRRFSPKWAMRGHVGVTGSLPPNQPQPCNGPSAGLWIHDATDPSNLIATNIKSLELSLATNGCTGNYMDGPKQPWQPAEMIPGLGGGICQEYTGCDPEVARKYPLVFCTTSGKGHSDQSVSAIPAFTKFFELLDPQ
ncbi:MAG TPA: hypothetical protein VHB79_13405 [Polyangiaceae bacterium]|nr:hypothetical protein [Polyangiaceae bacterium]